MKIKFDAGARLSTFLPCQQIFTYENNLINFIQHEAILGGAFSPPPAADSPENNPIHRRKSPLYEQT
jgi:hypothetical protein